MVDNQDGRARTAALGLLSQLQAMLQQFPADDPAYADLLDRRLVAGAEALNCGLEECTVRAIGNFTAVDMTEVVRVAEEFRADDDELADEVRTAPSHDM